MLDLIDESLEAFFRATVPLDATDVDVSFEAPEREWSAKLNRPTVNAFLWDIRRSTQRAKTGMQAVQRNGQTVRRLALPTVELRYVVTAWTSAHGDERALLAGLMRAILASDSIPEPFLAELLRELEPPSMLMLGAGEEHVDVFKALEGQLKPGINVLITCQVDIGLVTPVGPPVRELDVRVADRTGTATSSVRRIAGEVLVADAIGVIVHSPVGAARVNAAGRFLINARPGDEVVVETSPPRVAVVPPAGGVRIE
ncbi:MAG: Pvc16 family protein [Ilumatobacteraceae bacterium]